MINAAFSGGIPFTTLHTRRKNRARTLASVGMLIPLFALFISWTIYLNNYNERTWSFSLIPDLHDVLFIGLPVSLCWTLMWSGLFSLSDAFRFESVEVSDESVTIKSRWCRIERSWSDVSRLEAMISRDQATIVLVYMFTDNTSIKLDQFCGLDLEAVYQDSVIHLPEKTEHIKYGRFSSAWLRWSHFN